MRSRIVFFALLVLALFILIGRSNSAVQELLLDTVTPLKQNYKHLVRAVKDRGETYIFQKEAIKKLTEENKRLRTFLLNQTHYLQQVSDLFRALPSLEKLPHHSIELVDTVSYTRLNSFNEVQLTRPEKAKLEPGRLYGLIQNDVVGGTAVLRGKHLYGYLTSNPRCRFSVFIGPKRAPGVAEGIDKTTMRVRFIPKWSKIDVGDKVETSGLDGIFFANVPVGYVKEVKIEDSYKTAYIQTYNDTLHPDYFFLVTDASPYLTSTYDKESTQFNDTATEAAAPADERNITLSSVPETVQTQDEEIDPSLFEIPKEQAAPKPPVVLPHPKVTSKSKPKAKKQPKKKPKKTRMPPKPRTQTPPEETTPPSAKAPAKPVRKRPSPMDILNGRRN
jgi:rod shape-determining protein MreC